MDTFWDKCEQNYIYVIFMKKILHSLMVQPNMWVGFNDL